jgi:hypothetical protein
VPSEKFKKGKTNRTSNHKHPAIADGTPTAISEVNSLPYSDFRDH